MVGFSKMSLLPKIHGIKRLIILYRQQEVLLMDIKQAALKLHKENQGKLMVQSKSGS